MTRLTLALIALAACWRGPGHLHLSARARPDAGWQRRRPTKKWSAGQKAVQQFNEDINAYNSCLDLEMATLEKSGAYDENRLTELRAMQAKKNNAAVDEVQAVADRFNEQLRIFKARDKQD